MIWKDVSRFSQNDKVREPNMFQADVNGIIVLVHRHIYCPGTWVWTVREFNIDYKDLGTNVADYAKEEALARLEVILKKQIDTYKKALKMLKA